MAGGGLQDLGRRPRVGGVLQPAVRLVDLRREFVFEDELNGRQGRAHAVAALLQFGLAGGGAGEQVPDVHGGGCERCAGRRVGAGLGGDEHCGVVPGHGRVGALG